MKKLLFLIAIVFAFALSANAQNCAELSECNQKLETAARIINRQTDEAQAKDSAITALKAELSARENLDKINDELLAKKNAIIADQDRLIKILEKQSKRKVKFLYGLISITY